MIPTLAAGGTVPVISTLSAEAHILRLGYSMIGIIYRLERGKIKLGGSK